MNPIRLFPGEIRLTSTLLFPSVSVIVSQKRSVLSTGEAATPTSGATVPAAPVLTAGPGNATVALSWTVPADGGSAITGYKLYRNNALLTSPAGTTYTDNAVVNNTTYTYAVSAVNAVGEGPQSAVVSATPIVAGSAPAIPPNILGSTPATKWFGWDSMAVYDTGSWGTWDANWGMHGTISKSSDNWMPLTRIPDTAAATTGGHLFYWTGTDHTAIADPRTATQNATFDHHQVMLANGVPSFNGQPYGGQVNQGDYGPVMYKKHHDPTYLTGYGIYLWRNTPGGTQNGGNTNPMLGDWYDDTIWLDYQPYLNNLAAGLKSLNMNALSLDMESPGRFGPQDTTGLPSSLNGRDDTVGKIFHRTTDDTYWRATNLTGSYSQVQDADVRVKIRARGKQFASYLYSIYPDLGTVVYSWNPPGGFYWSKFVSPSAATPPDTS